MRDTKVSHVTICDRCGSSSTKNWPDGWQVLEVSRYGGSSSIHNGNRWFRKDLCRSCINAVLTFIEAHPRDKVRTDG
jgi:hypothetical protein